MNAETKTNREWRDVDPAEIGGRVRSRRVQLGKSQREIAFPGCSYAYLSRIEAGTRTPSGHLLEELARRLDVSRQWLEHGTDEVSVVIGGDAARDCAVWIGEGIAEEWRRRFTDDDQGGGGLSPTDYAVLPAVAHLLDSAEQEMAHDLIAGKVIRHADADS